jgi:hypothetical protein
MTPTFACIFLLLDSSGFAPHGFCYQWDRRLILLHVTSDALIAAAYMSIPITLLYFVRQRRDLPFHWIFGDFVGLHRDIVGENRACRAGAAASGGIAGSESRA